MESRGASLPEPTAAALLQLGWPPHAFIASTGAEKGRSYLHGDPRLRIRFGYVYTTRGNGVAAFARELAAKPPLALGAAKHSLAVSPESDLAQMLEIEREAQMRLFRSADVREGIAAFNEKRKAEFRGE